MIAADYPIRVFRAGFRNEQQVLKASIFATMAVATAGLALGIVAGSFSIMFDGVYSLVDAAMSILSLLVVRLITSFAASKPAPFRLHTRFSMGFWHLEPMVLAIDGLMLIGVAIYALINAVATILNGGRHINFDVAILYAAITFVICTLMATLELRANRRIKSDFLKLDVKAWLMSAGISGALLIAFAGGATLETSRYDHLAPYVDPTILAVVCLVIIPLPVRSVKQALSDMLLVTPVELKARVDRIAQTYVEARGFVTFRAYVAKVGRAREIELYFIVRPDEPARSIGEWDALRDQIAKEIGGEGPDRWLTIVFTEDLDWA